MTPIDGTMDEYNTNFCEYSENSHNLYTFSIMQVI